MPYKSTDRTLIIGDGNFSFSLALARLFGSGSNITATSYDTEHTVTQKYEEASQKLVLLQELGTTIFHGVDATQLHIYLPQNQKGKSYNLAKLSPPYDRIIFNFPHAGAGIKDQARNVFTNQQLLLGFFQSSQSLLSEEGEIHVTLRTGLPYDKWEIVKLAGSTQALRLRNVIPFDFTLYEGYEHRRTIGFEEGISKADNHDLQGKECKTYVFDNKINRNSSGGSNKPSSKTL